ncbi:hypothetical protein BDV93DRAFT_510153 [Ceratobasidium sp. AG-I]|nr:hypothetical protein BDV93DRAFT_510153 [Ceratobasidium sp. AG-I]
MYARTICRAQNLTRRAGDTSRRSQGRFRGIKYLHCRFGATAYNEAGADTWLVDMNKICKYDSLGRDGQTEAVGVRQTRKTGDGGWEKKQGPTRDRVSPMVVVEARAGKTHRESGSSDVAERLRESLSNRELGIVSGQVLGDATGLINLKILGSRYTIVYHAGDIYLGEIGK